MKQKLLWGLGIFTLLGLAAFWIWAFSPLPSRGHPDTLEDTAFPVAAESHCKTFMEELAARNIIWEVDNPSQLARQSQDVTKELSTMVTGLVRLADEANSPRDDIIRLWLTDWGIYLADRQNFEARLSLGERASFVHTTRDGSRISDILNRFAEVNNMFSCTTPDDI